MCLASHLPYTLCFLFLDLDFTCLSFFGRFGRLRKLATAAVEFNVVGAVVPAVVGDEDGSTSIRGENKITYCLPR